MTKKDDRIAELEQLYAEVAVERDTLQSFLDSTLAANEALSGQRLSAVLFAIRDELDAPRPFILNRTEDVSGMSGTGIVAWGVEFPDMTVALRWNTEVSSGTFFESLKDLERIHGHDGRTVVVWLSTDLNPYLLEIQQLNESRSEISLAGSDKLDAVRSRVSSLHRPSDTTERLCLACYQPSPCPTIGCLDE